MAQLVTQIQDWLSPKPKRSVTWNQSPLLGPGGCASTVFLDEGFTDTHGTFLPFAMRQTLYKDHEFHAAGHALEGPPMHRHIDEVEHFTVEKGQIVLFSDPDTTKPLPGGAQSPTTVIPPMVAHRFLVGKETPDDLTVVIASKGGRAGGIDEQFFRNVYSYQADCIAQGLEPSKLQYLVFFHDSNTLLADPPIVVARAANLIGSWIGYLLGYRASYPEYYRPQSAKTK